MDTAQWPQEILVKPIEEIIGGVRNNNKTWGKAGVFLDERNKKKELEGGLKCPRCNSSNTKFCYYNNYSLTQPRYFCKSCRRYWTEGGSLRNIPVGGSSRKNKRPSSSSSSSSSPSPSHSPSPSSLVIPLDPKKFLDHQLPQNQNPKIISHSQDLNLSFPPPPPLPPSSSSHHHHNNLSEIIVGGGNNNPSIASLATAKTTTKATELSAMELLTGMASNNSKGLNCFIPIMQPSVVPDEPGSVYTSGFPDLHDHQFKPSQLLGFSLDGYGGPTEPSNGGVGGRLMQLPFEDLKQDKDQQGDSTGYWTGMLGGGSW